MRSERVRLFENPLLERLTLVRPLTVVLVWGSVIGALLGWSAALPSFAFSPGLAWAMVGWTLWTLFEYGLHRFVFHWRPASQRGRRLVFLIHGCHHAQPEDPERAVMPLIASAPLAIALFGLTLAVLPMPWAGPCFAGFLAGYLHYDLTHWACHQTLPHTAWGRLIKRHHLRHHYAMVEGNWGVSTPVWDRVFGTVVRHKAGDA